MASASLRIASGSYRVLMRQKSESISSFSFRAFSVIWRDAFFALVFFVIAVSETTGSETVENPSEGGSEGGSGRTPQPRLPRSRARRWRPPSCATRVARESEDATVWGATSDVRGRGGGSIARAVGSSASVGGEAGERGRQPEDKGGRGHRILS